MRRILLALPLLLLGASFSGPGISKFRKLDYCIPFFERAMDRKSSCVASPTLQTVADSVAWLTLSTFGVYTDAQATTPSTTYGVTLDAPLPSATVQYAREAQSCVGFYPSGYSALSDLESYVAGLNALRGGKSDVQAVLFTRFDLMGYPDMALPGVSQSWFATTSQAWADRVAAITESTSAICQACTTPTAGHCSFLYTYGTPASNHSVQSYADRVSPQTPDAWKSFVYYMPHTQYSDICNVFNNAIVMKVGNADYRTWLLARYQGLWDDAKDWAWGFEFDTKFSHFSCRESAAGARAWHHPDWYIGGTWDINCVEHPSGITIQDYYATNSTPFSASPTPGSGGADWTDYVQGYRAVIEALRARSIPVQLRLSETLAWWNEESTWEGPHDCDYSATGSLKASCRGGACDGTDACDYWDDPNTTTHNENDDVLAIYRAARRVFYEGSNANTLASEAAFLADLESYGVEVIRWDAIGCGQVP